MATITALYEGKVSVWNDEINQLTGFGQETVCLHLLFDPHIKTIAQNDDVSFIAIQIPKIAITHIALGESLTFHTKTGIAINMIKHEITLSDDFERYIVFLKKVGTNFVLNKIDRGFIGNLDMATLNNIVKGQETSGNFINCTVSRPPCSQK
ncbi:hypothetical protein [Emticicia sp. SJ17W-69]|uniref:hypothetical protein n=1 Tax=Emticicia sp. SJ17W-69 TaxID=3421657 RepID=UPI003EB74A66